MKIVDNIIDLPLISESKLGPSFPPSQFIAEGYQPPFREDRNERGGGLLLFVSKHIPCKRVNLDIAADVQAIAVEINLKKSKWLLIGSYNPHRDKISNHLRSIGRKLNALCMKYDNLILMGDYNCEITEEPMKVFCDTYNLTSLVNVATCFKSIDRPTSIDLILTNKKRSFQSTSIIETGLSDFHKLTTSILKTSFCKQKPKVIHYRSYKDYVNQEFQTRLGMS